MITDNRIPLGAVNGSNEKPPSARQVEVAAYAQLVEIL